MSKRQKIGELGCSQVDPFVELETLRVENEELKGEVAQRNDQIEEERSKNYFERLRVEELESALTGIYRAFFPQFPADKQPSLQQVTNEITYLATSLRQSDSSSHHGPNSFGPFAQPQPPPPPPPHPPRVKRHSSSEDSKLSLASGETDSGIVSHDDSSHHPITRPDGSKPLPVHDDDVFIVDDEDDDDIIVLPGGGEKGLKSRSASEERLRRRQQLDEHYRGMVMRANRASPEDKQTILDFMSGEWKKAKGKSASAFNSKKLILLSEGNERLKTDDSKEPQLVFVETYFEMNYLTGKLEVKKTWKRVPELTPPVVVKRPPSECN